MPAALRWCALLCLLAAPRVAHGEPAAPGPRTYAGHDRVVAAAREGERQLARRLFGFQWPSGVPDPNELKDKAGKFIDDAKDQAGHVSRGVGDAVGDAAKKAKDAAEASFNAIKDAFNSAATLVEEGRSVVSNAANASTQFSEKMASLFKEFQPLQPIFGATHGIVPLLTSSRNTGTLVDFLVSLMDSATELVSIGTAVGTVSTIFGQLFDLFNQELSKLNGVIKGRRLLVDYTALLGGLDFNQMRDAFQDFADRATTYVNQVKAVNRTLGPLLKAFKRHLNGGRRLSAQDALAELKADQLKYEGAILSVVPTWQSVEGLAIEVCGQTDNAMREVTSLQCRVQGFASVIQLPGAAGIQTIVDDCVSKESQNHTVQCPGVAQSAGVRDMLSDSAGVLGWIALYTEYAIRNSDVLQILCAVLCLVVGAALALFGYRYKDCEFWVEGLVAGFVVWSVVASVVIVFFGVCRGQVIDSCEPKWMLLGVGLLSIGCAVTTVKAQKVQLFLAGFDVGAILGGFLYIAEFKDQIFNTFVSTDNQQAKVIMGGFLAAALVTGLIFGSLTVFMEKLVLVCGTAGVGGFIVMVAVFLFSPHALGWADLIGWLSLTVVASVVQYRYTAPVSGGETVKAEEEAPLTGGA